MLCNCGYVSHRSGLQFFFLEPVKPSITFKAPRYSPKSSPSLTGKKLFKNTVKYINLGIYRYRFSCRIASTIFLTAYSGSRIGKREGQPVVHPSNIPVFIKKWTHDSRFDPLLSLGKCFQKYRFSKSIGCKFTCTVICQSIYSK